MNDKDNNKKEGTQENSFSRRKFVSTSAAGLAGLGVLGAGMGSVSASPSPIPKQKTNSTKGGKRVIILNDTSTHIGPTLARNFAKMNHNIVLGTPAKGLADEVRKLGAKVVVVDDLPDLSKPEAVKMLVDAAMKEFGGYDAVYLRSGTHGTGDILNTTPEVLKAVIEQNFVAVVYGLQAVLPHLMDSGSGQVLILTSASGQRPAVAGTAYSATRAGANMLVRCAAMTAAPKGVSINAFGTDFLNYPGFIDAVGGDKNPAILDKVKKTIPLGRLGEAEEAAHFAMALLDGVNSYQTGNFFCHSGGYNNE